VQVAVIAWFVVSAAKGVTSRVPVEPHARIQFVTCRLQQLWPFLLQRSFLVKDSPQTGAMGVIKVDVAVGFSSK